MAIVALLLWLISPPRLNRGYFPIGVGYVWVYGSGEGDVVFEVTGKQSVAGTECYAVRRTIGEHQLDFFITVDGRGVLLHRVGEDVYTPPYRQFAFGTKEGSRWRWEGKIGDEAAAYDCVNYGRERIPPTFDREAAFWIEQNSNTGGDTDFWLARGVGVVRLRSKSRDAHDPLSPDGGAGSFDWSLKDFRRP